MPTHRPQLRRCRSCQKVGHNTSTCPFSFSQTTSNIKKSSFSKNKPAKNLPSSKNKISKAAPDLKFYVHHVNFEPRHSPHVVNLKQQKLNVWDQVTAAAPPQYDEQSLYHFHHQGNVQKQAPVYSENHEESPTPVSSPLFVDFKHSPEPAETQFNFVPQKPTRPSLFENFKNWRSTRKNLSLQKTALSKTERVTSPLSPSFSKTTKTISLSVERKPSISFSFSRLLARYFSLFTFRTKVKTPKLTITSPVITKQKISRPSLNKRLSERWQSFSTSFFNSTILRRRLAFALAALLIISIVPTATRGYYLELQQTKQTVTNQSTAGFMSLQESTSALLSANLSGAEQSTIDALQNFNAAVNTLQNNHQLLQKIVSVVPVLKDEVQSRQKLIEAGQKISLGNTYLLKGLETTQEDGNQKPTERLQTISNHLQAAIPNYENALSDLNQVKAESLPPEFQAPFKDFKTIFTAAVGDLRQLVGLSQSFQEVFGGQGLRRYLVMFQNPDELRPTGGFTGSFAVIDIQDGKLVKVDVPPGGTYDVQGQLDKFVEPPVPFLLFSQGYWQFHDANWFPDYPTSAKNTMWFYRHTGRGSVDGVISINSTFLSRLLTVIGPVQDEKRGITLTGENALLTLRSVIDTTNNSSTSTKPKQVISDLTPQFLDYFKNLKPNELLPLLVTLKNSLDEKEIQLYVNDKSAQEKITSFGWDGSISPTLLKQDYLNVNITNVNGGKTDAKIEQHLTHQVVVEEDGSVMDTVVITRKHTGTLTEAAFDRPNIAYFRVYTPEGSTLISVNGIVQPSESAFHPPVTWAEKDEILTSAEQEIAIDEKTGTRITNEFGKTTFGNWIITKPGETSQIQISYKLPFRLFDPTAPTPSGIQGLLSADAPEIANYQLVVQKQSGINSSFESQIIFPTSWQPAWSDGINVELAANGASISTTNLLHDSIWSLTMQKKK
jgi:hypothetical protein